MTLEFYIASLDVLNKKVDTLSAKLLSFPRGPMGLVEWTPEYITAKQAFDSAYKELKTLNKSTPADIRMQYSQIRRNKKQ